MRAQAAKAAEDATTGTVSEGSLSSPPDLELHLTLDFYFVYEFHLTLLGSPRELTAQATERPLDLYSKYEFHFTLLSSPFLRGAHGAGCRAAPRTSTSCTSPTSRSGKIREHLRGAPRNAAAQIDQVAASLPTCAQLEDCLRGSMTSLHEGTLARPVAGAGVRSRTSTS